MTEKEKKLNELFQNLKSFVEKDDTENILNTSEEILIISPEEKDAIQCKVVSLMEFGEYKNLCEFIKEKNLIDSYAYEYVYSLFGWKKYEEALKVLNEKGSLIEGENTKEGLISKLYLEAQILFCLGNYSKCVGIYEDLIFKNGRKDRDTFVNYFACLILAKNPSKVTSKEIFQIVQNELLNVSSSDDDEDDDSEEKLFALYFNIGCSCCESLSLEEARKYLNEAKKLYHDEKTVNKNVEVLGGYIEQLKGNEDEAVKIYKGLLEGKTIEQSSVPLAVAGNNLVSIFKEKQSVYEINRRLKFSDRISSKLTKWQKRGIHLNRILWLLKMKKFEEVENSFKELEQEFPNTDIPTLIQASLMYKKKQFTECVSSLEKFVQEKKKEKEISKDDEDSIQHVELSLAQVHINKGETEKGIAILKNCKSSKFPRVVSCIVGLYRYQYLSKLKEMNKKTKGKEEKSSQEEEKVGRTFQQNVISLFDESLSYWNDIRKNGKEEQIGLTKLEVQNIIVTLLNESGLFKLSIGMYEEAIKSYESIIEMNTQNKKLFKAYLVNVLFDFISNHPNEPHEELKKKIQEITKSLPEVDVGSKWMKNLDFLEKIDVRKIKSKREGKKKDGGEKSKEGEKKKKKNKRLNKRPKDFEQNRVPDPERWLPKWERKEYIEKKKKMQKRWQGASVDSGLEVDEKKKAKTESEKREKFISKQLKGKAKKKSKKDNKKRKRKRKR